MTYRYLPISLLCVAAVLFVAAVQTVQKAGTASLSVQATVVEAWGWNIAAESLAILAPEFERQHPGVDVQVKVDGALVQTRLLLSLAGERGAPGTCQLQQREAGKFIETGRLADLSPWAGKYASDFPAAAWRACTFEGGVYAVPWDIGPCAVFYKRWVFSRYDIDPSTIETWDDFIRVGQQLKERSRGRVNMMPLSVGALGDTFQVLMQQAGGGVFDDAGRIIVNNAANVQALETLRRLLDAGIGDAINFSSEEGIASYANDTIACYPGAVWLMQNMKDKSPSRAGQWGVFRLPAQVRGGVRNSNLGGSVLIVPNQGTAVQLAEQFVEHALCRVDSQLTQWQQKGLYPAYLPALRDKRFDTTDPFFGNQRVATLFAQDYDKLVPLVRTSDWSEAESIFRDTLSDWARNREDHGAYLDSVAHRLAARTHREIVRLGVAP